MYFIIFFFLIARYGFKNVLIPNDLITKIPEVDPFSTPDLSVECPYPNPQDVKIDAIMVFHDPKNWGREIQLMCDYMMWGGYLQPQPNVSNECIASDKPVVFFSNDDLLWSLDYDTPRIGQGGFRAAAEAVYEKISGKPLKREIYGKPHVKAFDYAEKTLNKYAKIEGKFDTIFMVGDNPASDIVGSKNRDGWVPILLRTGVYQGGPEDGSPAVIVDDVLNAVEWGIAQSK